MKGKQHNQAKEEATKSSHVSKHRIQQFSSDDEEDDQVDFQDLQNQLDDQDDQQDNRHHIPTRLQTRNDQQIVKAVPKQSSSNPIQQLSRSKQIQRYKQQIKDRLRINKKQTIAICAFVAIIVILLIIHHIVLNNFSSPDSEKVTETKIIQKSVISQQNQLKKVTQQKINENLKATDQSIDATPGENAQPQQHQPQKKPIFKQSIAIPVSNQQTKPNTTYHQKYSNSLKLNDFSTEEVYLTAPAEMQQIFREMIRRPPNKRTPPNSIFMPTEKAYFAYSLFKNPDNKKYQQAQYYYYDHKYSISQYGDKDQLHMCIVAPGRNIAKGNEYKRFIDSVQRQNYTNYRVVYIDDVSDDNSPFFIQNYVKESNGHLAKLIGQAQIYEGSFIINKQPYKNEQDKRRFFIYKNQERVYALANRNKGIRNYCPEDSIVLDFDADDAFIGRQALKFVNAIYQNYQVWMFNSVFIYDKSLSKQVTTGPQDGVPLQILKMNTYRTSMIWKTSELRTFRAKLFLKINEDDFKDEKGKFYQWASDVFTQQPLIELAGPLHYKHLYQIVYFYDWDFDQTTVYKRRHYRDIAFMQTPYKPLASLDDKAQKVDNYTVPKHIRDEYEKNIAEGRKQAAKYRREMPF